jgi:hypothetical protein
MAAHGKWTSRFVFVYYVIGSVYYIHHWLIGLGVLSAAAFLFKNLPDFLRYATPSLSVMFLYAGIAFWRKKISFQLNGPNPCLRFNFLEVSYREIDAKTCESHRKANVTAVYPVDHYLHKFNWSGNGNAVVEITSGANKAELIDVPLGMEKGCKVCFERPLHKKEQREFSYRLVLTNARDTLKHFLGHRIDSPTAKLIMRVQFESSQQKSIRGLKQLFLAPTSEIPLWEEEFTILTPNTEVVWSINRPRNGYYYRISWC